MNWGATKTTGFLHVRKRIPRQAYFNNYHFIEVAGLILIQVSSPASRLVECINTSISTKEL